MWVGFMTDAFPAGHVDISQIPHGLDLPTLTSDEDDQHICALAIEALLSSPGSFALMRSSSSASISAVTPTPCFFSPRPAPQ